VSLRTLLHYLAVACFLLAALLVIFGEGDLGPLEPLLLLLLGLTFWSASGLPPWRDQR
jgi:peptidoglycan/LPS O-acetylase OafA/YrhL